jgi:hypothetical protein
MVPRRGVEALELAPSPIELMRKWMILKEAVPSFVFPQSQHMPRAVRAWAMPPRLVMPVS